MKSIALLPLAFLSVPAFADTLYVDLNGNCAAGNGNLATPFCNLTDAVAAAVSGDTIIVAAGVYPGGLNISEDITIKGSGGGVVELRGDPDPVTVRVLVNSTVVLEDLHITGARRHGVENFGTLTLRRCTVRDNTQNNLFSSVLPSAVGIENFFPTGPLTLQGCTIEANTEIPNAITPQAVGGLWSRGSQPLVIRDCEFRGNGGSISSTLISDSPTTIEGSAFDAQVSVGDGVQLLGAASLTSSTFAQTVNRVIVSPPSGQTSTVEGCTLTATLVRPSTGSPGPVRVGNTILSGTLGGPSAQGSFTSEGFNLITNNQASSGFGTNDIVGTASSPVPPVLAGLAENGGPTRTMALLLGSPAIGAANPTDFPRVDQRGRLRLAGSADIGAYQVSSPGVGFHTPSCPGTINGGGLIARTVAIGSTAAAAGNLTLAAVDVTPNQFGIFLASRRSGFRTIGNGNLCLTGVIGRFVAPGQIQNSGTAGRLTLPIDLTLIPQGSAFESVVPGETWVFQAWFRDTIAESGFAVATEVTFQ